MREIKFRGKRIDNGEWVYGWFVGYSEHSSYIFGDYVDKNEVWKVLTETVGQFTGLLDKNGREIYEGDIVRTNNQKEVIGQVYYEDAQWFGAKDYLDYAVAYGGAEVIGNRFENPELLEGAK